MPVGLVIPKCKKCSAYHDGDPATAPFDADIITMTTYDRVGRVVQTITNVVDGIFDPAEPDRDRISRIVYDHLGRIVSRTQNYHPASSTTLTDTNLTTTTAYDPQTGRVQGVQDELGGWRSYGYDELGRVINTIEECRLTNGDPSASNCAAFDPDLPDRNVPTTTIYDARGRKEATIDALGHEHRTLFDGIDRRIGTIRNYVDGVADPLEPDTDVQTSQQYNQVGQLLVRIDAAGFQTRMAYNGLGYTTVVTDTMDRST